MLSCGASIPTAPPRATSRVSHTSKDSVDDARRRRLVARQRAAPSDVLIRPHQDRRCLIDRLLVITGDATHEPAFGGFS
jgi:hypothetical protein